MKIENKGVMDELEQLKSINLELTERLRVANETLESIRYGEVDAIVVNGPNGEQLYSLTGPDHPYQVFVENMEEAAVIISKEGTILYANNSFFEMIDSTQSDNVIGSCILDLFLPTDHSYLKDSFQSIKKKKSELTILTKQQKTRTILLSISKGVWGEFEQLCLLLTDISKLKRAQHYVEVSESIAKILSDSNTISAASNAIIRLLNTFLGWEVFIIWIWDKEKKELHCTDIAHIPDLNIEAFAKKTKAMEAEKTLVSNRVSLSHCPIWIEDVTEDSSFLRRVEARTDDLHGAFAFPFYQKSELAGVIELFRRAPFKDEVDDLTLNLMLSVGIEIGLYIQRISNDQTKRELATALDLTSNGIYSVDLNGIVTSWNAASETIYGWTAQEMIGNPISRVYPNETTQEFLEAWKTLCAGGAKEHYQSQRVKKDGKLFWVESAYGTIHDVFGKISGIFCIEQNITTEKELRESLQDSKEKFGSFIEITEDWIWEIDKNGVFLFSNQEVSTILGYEADEIVGKNFSYFLSPEDRDKMETHFKEYKRREEGWTHLTLHFMHKNGSSRWLESNAFALRGPKKEFIGFRGASGNVTESKNLEKIKNEFISIVGHELRTPLTSIYGALTLLMTKQMDANEREELIATAQRNAMRLTKLINDTTDIEKIELGKFNFDFKRVNLADVIVEAIQLSELTAKKSDIKIIVNKPLPVAEIEGDYSRLIQVMINLLSNAIKFSPNGAEIYVSMVIMQDVVRVCIKDQGSGISSDFQPKIFQMFAQAESSLKHISGGTGLGLFISKSIIEAHRGTIQFTTQMEEGTTFYFDLPLYHRTVSDG